MEHWSNKYIGIPYKAGGRDRTGCDCWGLVYLVLKEQFGKTIPIFDGLKGPTPEESTLLFDINRPLVDAYMPDIPKEGDIVLLRILGKPSHVGVYLGHGLMLHTMIGHDSAVDRVDGPRWAKKIEGFYRVR